jgi:hypothetical protein
VFFPSIHFRFSSFLLLFLLSLTSLWFNLCAEPPIPCFSSASSRGGTYSGGSGFCCFWSPRGWRKSGRRWCRRIIGRN